MFLASMQAAEERLSRPAGGANAAASTTAAGITTGIASRLRLTIAGITGGRHRQDG
jgi:hypothetical protein